MLSDAKKALPSATIKAPVALGETYTYSTLYYNNKGATINGNFGITINSVTDLTTDKAKNMGYKGFSNDNVEFKLVNITWDVIKVKVVIGKGKDDVYKSYLTPVFYGSIAPGVDYIGSFGYEDFTDSLKRKLNEEFKSNKLISDSITSFKITGDVILPVIKEEENYMRFVIPNKGDFVSKQIYFKLK